MSVEAGDLQQAHFAYIRAFDDFVITHVFDIIAIRGPSEMQPSQTHIDTVVFPRIMTHVNQMLLSQRAQQTTVAVVDDPRLLLQLDAAVDVRLENEPQVWREALIYIQRVIYVLESLSQEILTVRGTMNSWHPTTLQALDALGNITEGQISLDTQFTNYFVMMQNVDPSIFHFCAPTLASKLSSIASDTLWPAAARLWAMRSRNDRSQLVLSGIVAINPWPFQGEALGEVASQCAQHDFCSWVNGIYTQMANSVYSGVKTWDQLFPVETFPGIDIAVSFAPVRQVQHPGMQQMQPGGTQDPIVLRTGGGGTLNIGGTSLLPTSLFRVDPVPGELLHCLRSRTSYITGPTGVTAWTYTPHMYSTLVSKQLTTLQFPDLPDPVEHEILRTLMLYLEEIFNMLARLGVEKWIFTSGYAMPTGRDEIGTYLQLQNQVATGLRAALKSTRSRHIQISLERITMPTHVTVLNHMHNLSFRYLQAIRQQVAAETTTDDLAYYDRCMVDQIRTPWTFWSQYSEPIASYANAMMEFGYIRDFRGVMLTMATHMYSASRVNTLVASNPQQDFRKQIQKILSEYARGHEEPDFHGLRLLVTPILGPHNLMSTPSFREHRMEPIPGGGLRATAHAAGSGQFGYERGAPHDLYQSPSWQHGQPYANAAHQEPSYVDYGYYEANPTYFLDPHNRLVAEQQSRRGLVMNYAPSEQFRDAYGAPYRPRQQERQRGRTWDRQWDDRTQRRSRSGERGKGGGKGGGKGTDPRGGKGSDSRRSSSREKWDDRPSRSQDRGGRSPSQPRGGPPREADANAAGSPGTGGDRRPNMQCFRCLEFGHLARDCKLNVAQARANAKAPADAHLANAMQATFGPPPPNNPLQNATAHLADGGPDFWDGRGQP